VACDALSQLTIGGRDAPSSPPTTNASTVVGDILVVPPDTPHTFANAGASVLEMMGIHASERFVTIWLDG
jgi:hypothetical protein